MGTYGTLTLNTTTGAYSYTKTASAIEALDVSESGVDSFTFTVSDGDDALVTRPYTVTVTDADDAPTLAARAIGVPLPVESLAWWMRATPHARSPYAIERDASGRIAVLRQDGWTLVYAYADDSRRPSRVLASYPDIDVRVVIDAWR